MKTSLYPLFFFVSDTFDIPAFFKGRPDSFSFQAEPPKSETLRFYDTFDWKGWNQKKAIVHCGYRLSVVEMKNGRELGSASLRKIPHSFFAGAIGEKTIATRLLNLSKLRAFICFATVETEVKRWRVLDENQKTIASIELRSIQSNFQGPGKITVKLSPIRGYGKELETVAEHLKQSPDYLEKSSFLDFYTTILAATATVPANYSPKPSFRLKPGNTIDKSARELLLSTLEVIHTNEQWIPKNIDTEFLHDYRVATRRTRSILAQLKGIFPPEELYHYKQAFRELGKRTNNLRDQDVYLIQAKKFKDLLPISMRDSLDPFFTDLRNRHKKELRTFSRYLGSEKYRLLMQEWESFLKNKTSPDLKTTPDAEKKTSDVAVLTIQKAWKKVIRHGRNISRIATDTELHALRLDCKKLRYLLEFYASLFPAKTLQSVVRQLKTLQDNLGTFVDLSVQQNYLDDYLSHLESTAKNIPFAASLGGLVTALYHEREKVRSHFHSAFDAFDKSETEALFNELFNKYR
ncbi:CHAD domain-containing protein [Prosthecochloris sp. SCSIO W1103]|uniref:CHAD domain-containing protein n=1 Tax=Prosthecochloris sp. SCSIO W1103 TaxID=2992244 RepID=UPI00223C9828|nr:CHAD domain-containing protein [Prosthecochloris sp. SCSIO W1103]UZJ38642.1 CHAD domain-containing protein [Prosthecochloris sp. SCSIO W1103]